MAQHGTCVDGLHYPRAPETRLCNRAVAQVRVQEAIIAHTALPGRAKNRQVCAGLAFPGHIMAHASVVENYELAGPGYGINDKSATLRVH